MREYLRSIGRFVKHIAFLELALLLVTGLICWLGGWRTLRDYGQALVWAAIVAMAFGGMALFGGTRLAKDPTYRYIGSVSQENIEQRERRIWADLREGNLFLILMGIVGLIALGIGGLIQAVLP